MTLALHGSGRQGERLQRAVSGAVATVHRNVVTDRGRHPRPFLRAGGGYPDPWTRDGAINAWQGASLVVPEVARDTLDMVTRHYPDGARVVEDDQWWDHVVWVVAAWQHYLLRGDRAWLVRAHDIAARTLRHRHERQFDVGLGLYAGPAVMQDGISGYPDELADPARSGESFVLDHRGTADIACLSTNALYVLAYDAVAAMAGELGLPSQWAVQRGDSLVAAVREAFACGNGPGFGYVRAGAVLHEHEEALGLALAVLSGVASGDAASRIVAGTHREAHGVVSVWPHVQGFTSETFGRHNVACWPMVMGFWAQAVAATGDAAAFGRALEDLVGLVGGSGWEFFEVYDPVTGAPHGGHQAGRAWRSEPDQTWSATAMIGTVVRGLLGLRPGAGGLAFRPAVPAGTGPVSVTGIAYRDAVLDVSLDGEGSRVVAVRVAGRDVDPDAEVHVTVDATGPVPVRVEVA